MNHRSISDALLGLAGAVLLAALFLYIAARLVMAVLPVLLGLTFVIGVVVAVVAVQRWRWRG